MIMVSIIIYLVCLLLAYFFDKGCEDKVDSFIFRGFVEIHLAKLCVSLIYLVCIIIYALCGR